MLAKSKLLKLGKLLSGFSLGIFLNQGINLLLIPLFWSSLKPADFGVIAVCQMLSYFLSPVYMFGASETIQRFYYKWSEVERPHYLSSFFWFIFIFTLVLTIILDFLGSRFSHYVVLNVEFDPLLRMTLWSAFLTNLLNIPLAIARIKQTVLGYNFLLNGSFITQVSLTYYMVKIENLGAAGYIKGFFIANCLWFVPTLVLTFKNSTFIPAKAYRKIPLKYAAPLSLAGVIDGLSTTLDRFFLDKFVPLSTIGFYNLARQFGSLVNIINSVTKLIAVPLIYKKHALEKDTRHTLAHAGLIYSILMLIPVVAVSTLSYELVSLLDPSKVYLEIVPFIPYFALSFYFVCVSTITGRGMDLVGVTKWSFSMPLAGAIVSLIGYSMLLPEYGVWGVLYSMILGALARNLLYVILAYYYYPRELYVTPLISAWMLSFLCYFCLTHFKVENLLVSSVFKLLAIGLLGVAFWLLLKRHINSLFTEEKP